MIKEKINPMHKTGHFMTSIMKDEFIKTSILFLIVIMISNIINYLFQITMGRMLTVEKYGEMNSLMSIVMLLTVLFTPISYYFARHTAKFLALEKKREIRGLFQYSYTRFGVSLYLFVTGLFLLSPIIGSYIHIETYKVFLVFVFGGISITYYINNGFAQGLLKFRLLSLFIIMLSFFKYILSIIFVHYQSSVNSVLYAIICSGIITGLFSYLMLKHFLKQWQNQKYKHEKGEFKNYLLPLIISNFFFGTLTQIDVVLVKHFFSPYDAGIYASAAIIGKAVMYLPIAIVMSLFPIVTSENTREKETLHILFKAIIINTLIAGSGVLLILFFPRYIIILFFGAKYINAVELVSFFAIVMFIMGIISILMNYFLALGKSQFIFGLIGSLFIQIGGIYFFHNTLNYILRMTLFAGIFSLIIFSLFLYAKVYKPLQKSLS